MEHSFLTDAIITATYAHEGQIDKSGEPYILHCLRVMLQFSDDLHRAVAVLHDVVEDTHITLQLMEEVLKYPKIVRDAVDALSRRPDEKYFDYIRRCGENSIAREVKIADLKDNLLPERMVRLSEDQQKGLKKRYEKSLEMLGERPMIDFKVTVS